MPPFFCPTSIKKGSSIFLLFGALSILFKPDIVLALDWVGTTLDGVKCSGDGQGFGPYDFFDIDEPSDPLYQQGRHWEIKRLHRDRARSAMDEVHPIDSKRYKIASGELDYTLRAIPNEPYALQYRIELEMMRRQNPTRLISKDPPPECYLQRAIAYRPGQEHLRMLFGIYFNKIGMPAREMEQYRAALAVNPSSADAHYYLALALIKLDKPEEAVEHAQQAYDLGFPLPGVRKMLQSLGYILK